MSSIVLDGRDEPALQPATGLWAQADRLTAPYRFNESTAEEAREWQVETVAYLRDVIGFQELPPCEFDARTIEEVDCGDYVRQKVVIRTAAEIAMPIYLLLPKPLGKARPTVIAWAGHGYGVKDIVGLWEDGGERTIPDGYHKDFAVALCRRGFAVAAPEISCFGERQTDFSGLAQGQGAPSTCTHTAMLAFHLGASVVGLRVFDGRRLIDYLETRSEFDVTRLGAMGISGGGMHTFFSTCIDSRIRAAVVSGYFCTFRDSILAMHHCPCNFVPGLYAFGEMHDLVGLIAPRPLLIESGSHDMIFPRGAVDRAVDRARKVYEVFGAEDNIETDYFEGRHQVSGRVAYDFLANSLDLD